MQADVFFKKPTTWFAFSALGGITNAAGWIVCARFVTHVTGVFTQIGVDLSAGEWIRAGGLATIPLFVLVGSVVSAFLVDRRRLFGLPARGGVVMAIALVMLAAAVIVGMTRPAAEFGQPPEVTHDYVIVALLCLASGLQNALVTSASYAAVRTTHLTGILTDLGLGLVRQGFRRVSAERHRREIRANWNRFGTIGSFVGGAVLGGLAFTRWHYAALMLPCGLAALLWLRVARLSPEQLPLVEPPDNPRATINMPIQ